MTESGFTGAGGRKTHLSTCASVCAAIHRMSSGTSVPNPRTSLTMGPRFTVLDQIVFGSTCGGAGCSVDSPYVTPPTNMSVAVP